jgi:hypothetical protein
MQLSGRSNKCLGWRDSWPARASRTVRPGPARTEYGGLRLLVAGCRGGASQSEHMASIILTQVALKR